MELLNSPKKDRKKKLDKSVKNLPKESSFVFTEDAEKQKKRKNGRSWFFFELAEENKIIYIQAQDYIHSSTGKHSHRRCEKLRFLRLDTLVWVTEEEFKLIDFFDKVVNWQNSKTKILIIMMIILLYIIQAKFIDNSESFHL